MTTVYFICNNYLLKNDIVYQKNTNEELKKELQPLSFKGEKIASELLKRKELLNTNIIFSSPFLSSICTAKYLSEELDLSIFIDERLRERKVGILGINNERFLKETQEHDFDYKLHNGESLNMVSDRMRSCLKQILSKNENQTITIFTHDIAVESLFSKWCEKGYNLENQLILNFKENVIIDGAYHPFRVFKVIFEEDKIRNIILLNEKEL